MTDIVLPFCSITPAGRVDTGASWRRAHPTWLLAALHAGEVTDHDDGVRYPVEVHGLGRLPLPDGRLVGCDPYLAEPDHTPFDLALPPGEHPVAVGVVRIAENHIRPTALLLVTGSAPVVRWTLARTAADDGDDPDGDLADDAPGMITGYGVDAGTGAFLSPLALAALTEVGAADGGMLEDPLSLAMAASPVDAALLPPRPGALAVAQCSSGWGDGVYATWVGWDDAGAVSIVMTDFSVVGDPWSTDGDTATRTTTDVPATSPAAAPPADRPAAGGFWSRLFGGRGR